MYTFIHNKNKGGIVVVEKREKCECGRSPEDCDTIKTLVNDCETTRNRRNHIHISYEKFLDSGSNCMIQNRFNDLRLTNLMHLILSEMSTLWDYHKFLDLFVFNHNGTHGVCIYKDRELVCSFSLILGRLPESKKYIINLCVIKVEKKYQNKGISKDLLYALISSADIVQVDLVCNRKWGNKLGKLGFIPRDEVSSVYDDIMSYVEKSGNKHDKDYVFINIIKGDE